MVEKLILVWKYIKLFFICVGAVFVVIVGIAESLPYYGAWRFHNETQLTLTSGAYGTTFIGDCKDDGCIGVFGEAICFCRVENNHVIAVSHFIDSSGSALVITPELRYGIYDYVYKRKSSFTQDGFLATLKKRFPKTYQDFIGKSEKHLRCAKATYIDPPLKECPIYSHNS